MTRISPRGDIRASPIAAGLAGTARMSVSRSLPRAAVSAAVWTGSSIGIGYLLTHGVAGLARSVAIATLVGRMLLRQAQRRLLLHTLGQVRPAAPGAPAPRAASSGGYV